jgi:dolichyl-phosphate-mannose-protein mannosyltransferase
MKSDSDPSPTVVFLVIFAAIFLLHLPLLRLPYFWDEAGYYIPAARDLLLTGSLIPHSTPSNAHPPLVMAYLAAWWKIAGFSPFVTRSAMLLVAAFSLLGLFRVGRRVANLQVAVAVTAATALYPVFFAQSTMAHVDLAAAGLTLWGLESYLAKRWGAASVWFALAVLAKETAVLAPLALLGWAVVGPWLSRWLTPKPSGKPDSQELESAGTGRVLLSGRNRWKSVPSLLISVVVLCLWYAYHYSRTGHVFGNPEFFRYNVRATMSGVRILLALAMRVWQSFGYMHLWVLTLLMLWAMTRPPLRGRDFQRRRIDLAEQSVFSVLVLAYMAAMAVVGGAVLARYMLTIVPLMILVAVSTLWRRIRHWPWLVGAVCCAFVMALFFNPPYGFSPEDNLAYRDYVLMHEEAENFLAQRYPQARVLTAWPATDEISRTYLGYVTHPLRVVKIEDFTADEVVGAAQERSRFDVALVFSTKYEPPRPLLERWRAWERIKTRYFGFHRDLPPAIAAQILGGRVVFTEKSAGQWVAVIEIERVYEARRSD